MEQRIRAGIDYSDTLLIPPLGTPQVPGHRPDVGSLGGAVSHERGTPVPLPHSVGLIVSRRKLTDLFHEPGKPTSGLLILILNYILIQHILLLLA